MPPEVIELEGVSKRYNLYEHPGDRFKEILQFNRRSYHREHWAVRDVSVRIYAGETFCIVGENGSGKSTLLKLMVGILQPSSGAVRIRGRVTTLLELGSGFNPEFTGRANVILNGAILGLSRQETAARLDDILDFAEIGSYIDQPIKTYSSGMVVRLAFSVAVHLHPDILIVDEALAVGDVYFRQRCMRKIHELRSRGVTIVYVTHDVADVKAIGDRALWLHQGRVMELGDARDVAVKYLAALVKKDSSRLHGDAAAADLEGATYRPDEVICGLREGILRHGDGRAEILGIRVCDEFGAPLEQVRTPSKLVARVSARALAPVELPIIGVQLRANQGIDFAGTNTLREDVQLPPMRAGDIYTADFCFELPEMAATTMTLTPAIADGTLLEFRLCDMAEDAVEIQALAGDLPVYGYMRIPCISVRSVRTQPET